MSYELSANISGRRIKKDLLYGKTVVMEADIKYPFVDVPGKRGVSAKISGFYSETAKRYYERASGEIYRMAVEGFNLSKQQQREFSPYVSMMVYETAFNRDGLLSIYYDTYEYTGGAHGLTVRRANTWNLENGERVELEDLFKKEAEYEKIIIYNVIDQIQVQIASGTGFFFDDYKAGAVKYFSPKQFYLTDQGLAIYYNLYDIAPYASGTPVFTIPYYVLEPYLKIRL